MQKILTRIAAAVFVLQASLSYLPYGVQALTMESAAQAAVEKQAALDCRGTKLTMRKQVDELNRARSAVWAEHWNQYGPVMIEGFDKSSAAERLTIVKSMWTQVMNAQKQYSDQAQQGGESNVWSIVDQIQSILAEGTNNLAKLSINDKVYSWREAFLSLLNDQKSNYFQTIDIMVAYNNQYGTSCGAEVLPSKDSTDQDSMNRMANAKVNLTELTPKKDATPVATKQCRPSAPLVETYVGALESWDSFQNNNKSEISSYFASPDVQAILIKTRSTPEKLIQSVITAATSAQSAYTKAMATEGVNEKEANNTFQGALNNAPQAMVKVLGASLSKAEWFINFVATWQAAKATYFTYASSFIEANKQYGTANSCIPVTLSADPTNATVIAIFSSNKLAAKKPGDITPSEDACLPRKALVDELTKTTSSTINTLSRFMRVFALAGVFDAKSLMQRQQLVTQYNGDIRQIESDYLGNGSSQILEKNGILDAQRDAQQQAGMGEDQGDIIDPAPQPESEDNGISSHAVNAINLYSQLSSDMAKYLVDKDNAVYTKFIAAISNSVSDLAAARDAYRITLAKVNTFNQTAKQNKCALIPVNKADPLSQVLVQPFIASSSTALLQTFGLQSSLSQTDVSQDKAVQMQCFIDSSNLVALQNKALTTSKLRWFDLLSTLLSNTNEVFDKRTASTRKTIAIGYLSYMRNFRDNFIAEYAGNEGDTSIIANYGSQMAQGLLGVFGTMDEYVTKESGEKRGEFKANAEQVAYDTKQEFARVLAAYNDFNAQNAGQCSRLQIPMQDTVDTSFAKLFQK